MLNPATSDEIAVRPVIRAAQYVRMSTEHQKYSTENQAEIIALYAASRGIEIVRTYADEGKSGLNIRPHLQARGRILYQTHEED